MLVVTSWHGMRGVYVFFNVSLVNPFTNNPIAGDYAMNGVHVTLL